MAVTIKSPREIELMRKAGEILAQVHEERMRLFTRECPLWTSISWESV